MASKFNTSANSIDVGQVYGSWIVLQVGSPSSLCQCVCGKQRWVRNSHMVAGRVTGGCHGCANKRIRPGRRALNTTIDKKLYLFLSAKVRNAVARCTDPEHELWKYYGGRGVTVCQEWLDRGTTTRTWSLIVLTTTVITNLETLSSLRGQSRNRTKDRTRSELMLPYQELEIKWAEWNNLSPEGMVVCSSGTSALHLACEAMRGSNRGTRVMLGDLNMIACPRAISMAGMEPIFIDCDDTLNIDPCLTYDAVWNVDGYNMFGQGYAILATHIYGRRCNMNKLAECALDCCTYLIEDSAEAHGIKPHSDTDAMCTSFYSNKIVAGEEGGAVWFRDPEHAKLARQLRSLGFTDAHDFTHVPRGVNARMSNVHASLILDSLRRVELSIENRWLQWHTYNELCPKEWRMQRPDAPWVYAMRIQRMDNGTHMTTEKHNEIVTALKSNGIEARHCFKSCTSQEEYWNCKFVREGMPAMSAIMSREVIYLPLSSYSTRCHLEAFNVIQRILG